MSQSIKTKIAILTMSGVVMSPSALSVILAKVRELFPAASLSGVQMVLTPVGAQFVVAINHPAALEEVGVAVQTVIIETVGIESATPVFEHHVVAGLHQLRLSVVPARSQVSDKVSPCLKCTCPKARTELLAW